METPEVSDKKVNASCLIQFIRNCMAYAKRCYEIERRRNKVIVRLMFVCTLMKFPSIFRVPLTHARTHGQQRFYFFFLLLHIIRETENNEIKCRTDKRIHTHTSHIRLIYILRTVYAPCTRQIRKKYRTNCFGISCKRSLALCASE